ncbi:MFS siderochrome iron transporter 1-like protein [Elsinoe fawcettii]|nr:MFS siderochrome iron transporter 1-like protein [Elsinoe fawcettii]
MWDLKARLWDSGSHEDEEFHSAQHAPSATGNEKNTIASESPELSDNDSFDSEAQNGVKEVEALTSAWDKKSLMIAFAFVYIIYVVDSLQQQMATVFTPYVTSSFSLHSLTATTGILSNLIGGLARLPLAKILDVWGRREGFAIMVFCLTIGLIMMAATNSVEMYCAAQIFYWVGYTGITYVLAVFVSDVTSLKNRGLVFGLTSTPYIFTTWAGGPAANNFINGPGWRWGFGTFAIVTPVMCLPIFWVFWENKKKAKQMGILKQRAKSGRTALQSLKYYFIELDIFGLLLICSGLALFLLPFSLYTYQAQQWRSPMIICMLVFGIILLIIFGLYEKFLAPKSFLPIALLFDRTVFGSCVYGALAFVSFYIWNSYFYSFLIVVNGESIANASYIRNIYSIGSCFWAVIVGLLIKISGRFKALALFIGVPLSVLGVALMVAFRRPDVNIGYIVMCQIFIAFGGGTTVICQQIAVMAATTHQNIAVALAIQYAFASVGGAIGSSISAAVWTSVFPQRLQTYLPPESQGNFTQIYGDMTVQSSYAIGSPTRDAISRAYGDAQHYMLIAATCFLAFGWFFVLIWKDIGVKRNKQVKGLVV